MIFYDLETDIPGGKRSEGLRSRSGADVIISLKAFPPNTEAMIKKHIESGAILYRVMPSVEVTSISLDTLMFNLNKMQELSAKPWQSILIVVDDRRVQSYDDMVSKIDAWVDHGGSSMSTFGNPVTLYFSRRDKEFAETLKRKTVLVPTFVPRNAINVEKDWTLTLATFPGVGLQGAKIIRKIINDKQLGDDLLTALWFLTDEVELQNSTDENWRKVRENARKWLGLPDHFNLDIGIREPEG